MLKGDLASAAQIMESSLESPQSAWRYRHILWARKQRTIKMCRRGWRSGLSQFNRRTRHFRLVTTC